LVTPAIIENVLRKARRHGAALAASTSRDTVKIAGAKLWVRASPDRTHVWLAQTPQCFERRILERAHGRKRSRAATDDAQMVERLGARVKLVEAPAENMKITTPLDLAIAGMILERR
jgi:2-C-methyl-D-erythritol 4-phosphate cytidylyltransferase